MRYGYTEEQEQFRDIVRRFLREHSPSTAVRRQMASAHGYDPLVWQRLCNELGLSGVHVPEAFGGQGFGFVELGITLEEMGRALLCAPFFASSVLATLALMHGATPAEQHALLPSMVSGETLATLAFTEPDGRWDFAAYALAATPAGDGFLLSGTKKFVLDGVLAQQILVVGREPTGTLALFLVAGDASGLKRRALTSLDPTRRLAELVFTEVSARRLGAAGDCAAALQKTIDLATVALACEMVGGARTLLEMAVDYAKLRMQFGRPIGSFQAIKHKCAEMLLEVELAAAAARYAAAAAAEDDPALSALASHAKAMASDAYTNAAVECLQIHGGIGFTWDHDLHLWFKRARSSQVFLGDADYHRERYLALTEDRA